MRCTHCSAEYTRAEFDELPLVAKNGGRVTFGSETHEYRVCVCGSHVLLVTPLAVDLRPSTRPSFVPMFAEAADGRRR